VDPSAGAAGAPVTEADRAVRVAGAPWNLMRATEVDSCSQRFGMDWGRKMLGLGIGGLETGEKEKGEWEPRRHRLL
jgi:hypothetical protein